VNAREVIAERLRKQAYWCARLGSALYSSLLEQSARDAEEGGEAWRVLEGHESDPPDSAPALRFMAAVHRLVLQGRAPELAEYYPSAGGKKEGSWPVFRETLRRQGEVIRSLLEKPVQTNEVGRCAALVGGFLVVARATGLPLRCLELGASAGLNLRWDCYRYEANGAGWGDPNSEVRFEEEFSVPLPPFEVQCRTLERSGCDRSPVDPCSEEGQLSLQSYVWADQLKRLKRLRAAIEIAQRVPAKVEEADAAEWLRRRLAEVCEGVTTVVFHSIVWQYLDDESRARVEELLLEAGERASSAAPLAWLRMEPGRGQADVRLKLWPGGTDEVIAVAGFHGNPVTWLAAEREAS
jgi:hypothetical protein